MSGLPGRLHAVPTGACCERHPDRPAVANVQGETDSFGFETTLMCQECRDDDRAYAATDEARTGCCDWCKAHATDLGWTRNFDEGLYGPTYRICGRCSERQRQALREELDAHDDGGACWDDPSWDDPIEDLDDADFDDGDDAMPGAPHA